MMRPLAFGFVVLTAGLVLALQRHLPLATMYELPGAGYFFPASRPASVAGVVARFLGEPDGQEASAADSAKEVL